MIRCIILEDEIPAQEILLSYIKKTPFLTCIGTFESGILIPPEKMSEADLLFLDIQLPDLSGINFLKSIAHPPAVIITSAFTSYAIEAFEQAVVDYLVKPISYERFFKAVHRIKYIISSTEEKRKKQLLVYANKTMHVINTDDIIYVKAAVDYVHLILENQKILVLDSLKNWVEKLTHHNFVQTHRSYLVNLKKIDKLDAGHIYIRELKLPIGTTHKDQLLSKIQNKL